MHTELLLAIHNWKTTGSPAQEAFYWAKHRDKWVKAFDRHKDFIHSLPAEIDRSAVRATVEDSNLSICEQFLAVMIWGYGDRAYGAFRTHKVLSQPRALEVLEDVKQLCRSELPVHGYSKLAEQRIKFLGPAFATKFLNFCTPRGIGAPILDSFIAVYLTRNVSVFGHLKKEEMVAWKTENYVLYRDWIGKHGKAENISSEDVEYNLFQIALRQSNTKSSWL